jgi:hypothetical protein
VASTRASGSGRARSRSIQSASCRSRWIPSSRRSIASASVSRPGPEQSSSGRRARARRSNIASTPSVGSIARTSTAAPRPGSPQTTFSMKCMPYVKYT